MSSCPNPLSIFLCLPQVILSSILCDWIEELRDLTALDVALCQSTSRTVYLQLVSDRDNFYLPKHYHLSHLTDIDGHIRWLNRREIHCHHLLIDLHTMTSLRHLSSTVLEDTVSITLQGIGNNLSIEDFKQFLSQCPKLEDVHFGSCQLLPGEALEVIQSIPTVHLTSMDLTLCTHLPLETIQRTVIHFSSSLERLRLGRVDHLEDILNTISHYCINLKKLSLCTEQLDKNRLLNILASMQSLQSISLSDSQLTNDWAVALLLRLPHLIHLKFNDTSKISSSSLAAILRQAPNIHFVEVNAVYYFRLHCRSNGEAAGGDGKRERLKGFCGGNRRLTDLSQTPHCSDFSPQSVRDSIITDERSELVSTSTSSSSLLGVNFLSNNRMTCELHFSRSVTDPGAILEAIRAAPVPVSSLYCAGSMKTATLMEVMNLVNSSLHTLKVALHHDVNDDSILSLLSCQNHLRILEMSKCRSISDHSLQAIGDNCNHLRLLGIKDCHHITDAGVIYLLTRLNFRLRSLYLTGCQQVSDETLAALAVLGDNLVNISLYGTKITAEGLVDLLCQENCLKSIHHLTVNESVKLVAFEKLSMRLEDKNELSRWKRRVTSFIF
eukprot:gene10278-11374_t